MIDVQNDAVKEVIQTGIDDLESFKGQNIAADELHFHLYNEDYFIVGYYAAEKFLEKYGVFQAIELIREYEQSNFGEVNTDFSDREHVANMLAYIVGEEALNNCDTLQKRWNSKLSDDDLEAIKEELEAQL